ncbi:MAG: dihydroneopterin aldolase [Campylobacteraceae bacterium]|nr:dihydroneopterin aldolase [Campylobacteraceae bacterium]
MSEKITLLIEKFELETIIGLLEKEREMPQKVEVWAKIEIRYKKRSLIDYKVICDVIQSSLQSKKFFTIEEALLHISKKIAKISPRICKIYLKILKPSILENRLVGAEINKIF